MVHEKKGCPVTKPKKMSMAEQENGWGPWLRANIPRRPTTSNLWSGGSYPQTERRAAEENLSDGFHSKKSNSVNHGNPNTLDQYRERSNSIESVTYHKKGENMGRSNDEENSTPNEEVHASNGQKIRKERRKNCVGL